jgi:hypothetical protein
VANAVAKHRSPKMIGVEANKSAVEMEMIKTVSSG